MICCRPPLSHGLLSLAAPSLTLLSRMWQMVRGPKKHLKRLNAPRHWMLDKLGGVFAPKPAPGVLLAGAAVLAGQCSPAHSAAPSPNKHPNPKCYP